MEPNSDVFFSLSRLPFRMLVRRYVYGQISLGVIEEGRILCLIVSLWQVWL